MRIGLLLILVVSVIADAFVLFRLIGERNSTAERIEILPDTPVNSDELDVVIMPGSSNFFPMVSYIVVASVAPDAVVYDISANISDRRSGRHEIDESDFGFSDEELSNQLRFQTGEEDIKNLGKNIGNIMIDMFGSKQSII